MKSNHEELKDSMRKFKINPPHNIIADCEWHHFISITGTYSLEFCGYIVNEGEPLIANYNFLERNISIRWTSETYKALSTSKRAEYNELIEIMNKKRVVAQSAPLTAIDCEKDEATVARLAMLSVIQYEQVRNHWINELKMRGSILDKLVNNSRMAKSPHSDSFQYNLPLGELGKSNK